MLVAATCGCLGACGHSSGDSSAAVTQQSSGPGGKGAPDGANAPTDMVSAVSAAGRDEGPVGLKFQLSQRPVAGQAVVMTLRLVANQPLEHLEARFRGDDGLDISQGGDFDPEGHMDSGASLDHTMTLTPEQDGVYTVMATVTIGSTAEAVSRSFVIPIVVASATPPPPPPQSAPVAKKHR